MLRTMGRRDDELAEVLYHVGGVSWLQGDWRSGVPARDYLEEARTVAPILATRTVRL